MALAQAPPTASNIQAQSAQITWPEATGGTGPYFQKVYRSSVTGFTPGAGNLVFLGALIAGGNGVLTFNDTGLIPNTVYYYVVQVVDTGAGSATANSTQFTMASTSQMQLSQNVAVPTEIAGTVDQQFNVNSHEAVVDGAVVGNIYPGQAVLLVNSSTPFPTVTQAVNATDAVWGFVEYDNIKPFYVAGDRISVSLGGSVIRLFATATIAKGAQVCFDPTATAAVQNTGNTATLVGWAYDQGANNGVPFRVYLKTPSFATA